MKLLSVSLTAFLFVVAVQGQAVNPIDVLHYKFQLELSDASDSIKARASITIRFSAAVRGFTLDLSSAANGKGMTVLAVKRDEQALASTHKDDRLAINLPEEIKSGDTAIFIIDYQGIPSDGLIISQNKFGHRTFFADNWPNRGHNWIPCHDEPADKASVEFIVNAPQHYQVVANGLQLEETNISPTRKLTYWREDVPISTKVMVIGAADFAVNLAGFVDCIPVYSWIYPEEREKGFYDYAQALEILPFFIDRVGPYGYKKLANVESKTTFGGLENANTIFYAEKSINGARKEEELLTHEIAHQWFGNMATEKTFAHLWLSEGFATYFSILYFEQKYGEDTATKMRLTDREETLLYSKESNHPVVDTFITNYMLLLNDNTYQKGGWVLHMLRRQLGDSLFWQGIRAYYAEYAGKNADTDDLRKVFEKISGKDLQRFFKQWLFTGGQPDLLITWKAAGKDKISVTVIQQQKDLFVFPLEIGLLGGSGKMAVEKLEVNSKKQTFVVNVGEKIMKVVADPRVDLLFQGKVVGNK